MPFFLKKKTFFWPTATFPSKAEQNHVTQGQSNYRNSTTSTIPLKKKSQKLEKYKKR